MRSDGVPYSADGCSHTPARAESCEGFRDQEKWPLYVHFKSSTFFINNKKTKQQKIPFLF